MPLSAHTGRHLAADMVTALVSLALLAVLQNADVIVLGSQAPHRSGSYAAISVPSKALVYAAFVFVNYLLPESAIRWHQGSHALRQLGHTLLVLVLPAAVLLGLSPRWRRGRCSTSSSGPSWPAPRPPSPPSCWPWSSSA